MTTTERTARVQDAFKIGARYVGFGIDYGIVTGVFPVRSSEDIFIVTFKRPEVDLTKAFQWDVDHWNEVDVNDVLFEVYNTAVGATLVQMGYGFLESCRLRREFRKQVESGYNSAVSADMVAIQIEANDKLGR